jgi:hypothetical protein
MTIFTLGIAFLLFGYITGVCREKLRRHKFIKESYLMGYKDCNKKWKEMSTQEICKRLERRKHKQ